MSSAASYSTVVQQLYVTYFGRPADPIGLGNFEQALANANAPTDLTDLQAAYSSNSALKSLVDSFGTSKESTTLYGTNVEGFVNAVFENVLGRAPLVAGLTFWVNSINSGAVTLGDAALSIAAAALANPTDAATIAAKTTVAQNFTTDIGGSTVGILSYNGSSAAAQARLLLAGVNGSTDVTTYQTNVQTTVTTIEGIPTGTTVALTTGVDTLSAQIFNAVLTTASTATLNAFDSLTGSATTGNILNINSDGTAALSSNGITVTNIQTVNLNETANGSVNIASWSGVNALNVNDIGSTTAAAATIVAGSNTAITVTGHVLGLPGLSNGNLTIDGGSNVTVTASGADSSSGGITLGTISVGGTTAPTGAIVVNSTSNLVDDGSLAASVVINGGTSVTVNSVVNYADMTGEGDISGVIDISGAKGAVAVNSSLNVTAISSDNAVDYGDAVVVTGGTTVAVNLKTSASAAVLAALGGASDHAQNGSVTILDGGTVTSVTVNQQVASAVAATAAVTASPAVVTAVGGFGYDATVTPAIAAVAAIPGTFGIDAGSIYISAGSTFGTTLADASNTITSVSLDNYATANINSAVLTTLTLAGTGSGLVIENLGTTPETALALNLNGFTDATGITDAGIKTLNVVTGGATVSTLGAFTDSNLTTLNVAGTETLALNTVNLSLTKIAISGSAGFIGNVSALGAALTSFTTTSSGTITATLDAAHQSFVGSTGQDIITITGDALKTITGGSATNNELILNGDAAIFTAAHTVANVTGFTTLGIEGNSAGVSEVYNLSTLTGFKAIDIIGGSGSATEALSDLAVAVNGASTIAAETALTAAAETAGTITALQQTAIDTAYATAFTPGAEAAASGVVNSQVTTETTATTTLQINLHSASTVNAETALTSAAVTAGYITNAEKSTIDSDYAAEFGTSVSTAQDDAEIDAGTAAIVQIAALNTLATAVNGATTVAAEQALTASAVTAGTITAAEQTSIDNAYAAGQQPEINQAKSAAFTATVGVATSGSAAFINVATGTTLSIDASLTATGSVAAVEGTVTGVSVLYQVGNATGVSDSLSLKLGNTSTVVTVAALMLEDANAVGIATLNVVTAGTANNMISTLIDNGLATLNVSGSAGLTIGALTETTTQATAFTLNNTAPATTLAGAVEILALTDANLGSVTFTGSGNSGIFALNGVTGHIVTLSNNGTGIAGVGSLVDTSLQSLTLNGAVIFGGEGGTSGFATGTSAATGSSAGITVAGGTDNAHINLNLNGAAVGNTDKITVGNGNDYITDASTAGSVTVTVGTGSNYIDIHTGTGAGVYSVTLGTHTATTGGDAVYASEIGTFAGAAVANTTITGAVAGDVLNFTSPATTAANVTTVQQTAITAAASLSAAVGLAFGDTAANSALSFQYGGNTYVVEQSSGTAGTAQTATDSIVELVGLHTLTAGAVTSGHVVLAS